MTHLPERSSCRSPRDGRRAVAADRRHAGGRRSPPAHSAPAARLPTEAQLSARFGVNRHTVRRALEELSRNGLVRIEQGRGSFVAEDVLDYTVGPRTRFSEWIRRHNKEPSGRVLAAARDRGGQRGRRRARHPRGRAHRRAGAARSRGRPAGEPRHASFPGGALSRPARRAARDRRHHRGAAPGRRRGLSAPGDARDGAAADRPRRRRCCACRATGRCSSPRTSTSIAPARSSSSASPAIRRRACRSSSNPEVPMAALRITGGRVLLAEAGLSRPTSCSRRDASPRSTRRGTGARNRCARIAGAARHRRHPRRRVRAAAPAAAGRGFPGRARAGRHRGAVARQRHHHRLPRRDAVLGAGAARPRGLARLACRARRASPRQACDMRVHLRWEAFNLDALEMRPSAISRPAASGCSPSTTTPPASCASSMSRRASRYSERRPAWSSARSARSPSASARAAAEVAAGARPHRRGGARGRAADGEPRRRYASRRATHSAGRARGSASFRWRRRSASRRARPATGWSWAAPNVVRGGSHLGWASAARLAEAGICNVLASDYYYPAMLRAAFVLAATRRARPCRGLGARSPPTRRAPPASRIAAASHPGSRADLVLVDAAATSRARSPPSPAGGSPGFRQRDGTGWKAAGAPAAPAPPDWLPE